MWSVQLPPAEWAKGRLAVVATLSKGYDLDYIWRQVDRGLARDAAGYYLQASESGGEPPGRWWGPGAQALGVVPGQVVEREPYDLLFGERKAPDGTPLGRPHGNGRQAADIYARLLAAEPHATAERKRELRIHATQQARQSPLYFDLTLSLSKSISIFHASLGENARLRRLDEVDVGRQGCCTSRCICTSRLLLDLWGTSAGAGGTATAAGPLSRKQPTWRAWAQP